MTGLLDTIGAENLARLSEAAGGVRLYVPKHFGKPPNGGRDSSERLIALVGPDLGLLLVFHYADSVIYVPLPGRTEPIDVGKLKRLARRKDLSNRRIARLIGCTERTVEKHRARTRLSPQGAHR